MIIIIAIFRLVISFNPSRIDAKPERLLAAAATVRRDAAPHSARRAVYPAAEK